MHELYTEPGEAGASDIQGRVVQHQLSSLRRRKLYSGHCECFEKRPGVETSSSAAPGRAIIVEQRSIGQSDCSGQRGCLSAQVNSVLLSLKSCVIVTAAL